MAEPLAQEAFHGSSHNVLGGLTRAEFYDLLQRYEDIDAAVSEAVGDRKNLRAEIKGRGIPLRAWDRARRDADISGEKRELEEMAYRELMAFRMKPVGFQASFNLDPELSEEELAWIERQGLEAGQTGRRRDSNSYTPGTQAYASWDHGWVQGSGAGGRANGEEQQAEAAPTPRRVGRPRGSKNRPKTSDEAIAQAREHLGGEGDATVSETAPSLH